MRPTRWMAACPVGAFLLTSNFALAQGQGRKEQQQAMTSILIQCI
jgi:hypothetical protein